MKYKHPAASEIVWKVCICIADGVCASSQYNTFTADVNYSDKSAHLFSTDGFYGFTLTCFMDSFPEIVSSKFIVGFWTILLKHSIWFHSIYR